LSGAAQRAGGGDGDGFSQKLALDHASKSSDGFFAPFDKTVEA
jgi:hypothetical protein